MAQGILGYIKKYPKKAYIINPKKPNFDLELDTMGIDFGKDYDYFKEDIDPHAPESLHKELEVTIFIDSSHGEDTTTGRSITGFIIFLGSTPVAWSSKQQTSIQTSTFGTEFVALKTAVEHACLV